MSWTPGAARSNGKVKIIHFLLDETGSMQTKHDEAVNGFNRFLEDFDPSGADVRLSLTKFDSVSIRPIHEAVKLADVPKMTYKDFQPGAMTPLLDATAHAIRSSEEQQRNLGAASVMVVTLTDGLENASREMTKEKLNELIKQKESDGWTFMYLGVDKEAWSGAEIYAGTVSMANVVRDHGPGSTSRSYDEVATASSSWAGDDSGKTWTKEPDTSGAAKS